MSIIYKTDDSLVDFLDVKAILEMAFGGRRIDDVSDVKKAFLNSQYKIYAYDDSKLIGFARAIADTRKAIIYNVALNPKYQGNGIGKELINRLVGVLDGKEIYTFTHPRTISLYEHLGFVRTKMAFKYVKGSDRERVLNQEKVGFFLKDNYLYDGEKRIDNLVEIDTTIQYRNNITEDDIKVVNSLLEEAYLDKRDVEKTKKDLKRADFIEAAYKDNALVGFASLITDSVNEGILIDIVVKREYRNKGIGHGLIERITNRAKGYDIFIHTNPKALGFYNNSRSYKRYKTAFKYVGDKDYDPTYYLPRNYRFSDEYDNEVIKYYKGKILN